MPPRNDLPREQLTAKSEEAVVAARETAGRARAAATYARDVLRRAQSALQQDAADGKDGPRRTQ